MVRPNYAHWESNPERQFSEPMCKLLHDQDRQINIRTKLSKISLLHDQLYKYWIPQSDFKLIQAGPNPLLLKLQATDLIKRLFKNKHYFLTTTKLATHSDRFIYSICNQRLCMESPKPLQVLRAWKQAKVT